MIGRDAWPKRTKNTFTLKVDMWDDYRFKTLYSLYYGDGESYRNLGAVKIAQHGMEPGDPHTRLPETFHELPADFYSLGQDREYYEEVMRLPADVRHEVFRALRDVAFSKEAWSKAESEEAFSTSLLRTVPQQTIEGQFRRIISGKAPLTPFSFSYRRESKHPLPGLELRFDVEPSSLPPTNTHVIIGANGVGKSSLLRDFLSAANGSERATGTFIDHGGGAPFNEVESFPFVNTVHIAFSAFDQPVSVAENSGVHLVGLSASGTSGLDRQFRESLSAIKTGLRRQRWLRAMETLSIADGILYEAELASLLDAEDAKSRFAAMSSGHKIVLLTMTRLVEFVEEQSLILLDEPETHLHPPLLSALMRAISDLMIDRNGVAIIATHSPVVLQEVPRTCTWMLQRAGGDLRAFRISSETFGESVSRLTSEVFNLETNHTGFNRILRELLEENAGSAIRALNALEGQVGSEGRFILSALEDRE